MTNVRQFPVHADPQPPKTFSPEAGEVWRRTVGRLRGAGSLHEINRAQLIRQVRYLVEFDALVVELEKLRTLKADLEDLAERLAPSDRATVVRAFVQLHSRIGDLNDRFQRLIECQRTFDSRWMRKP